MTIDRDQRSAEIGARLRAARHALGWSLSELSARTSPALSKSRISNYEQGLRRVGLEEAAILADAMKTVTAAYLLGFEVGTHLTAREQALIAAFRATDKRGRADLLAFARTAADGTQSRPTLAA
jgi:transcriptional regulator with XRE-family HTH domain